MDETIKLFFAFCGVLSILGLAFIDRRFPGNQPVSDIAYWVIGGYIAFVFAGPRGVRQILQALVGKGSIKFGNFSIGEKENVSKKD